ncbi:MAG: cbb3-type cytochrome oxidase assembly protein CcoS [Bacteroidia bacterium]|jgi:cbb3-type cytochrome oxidase maturation protein
MSVVFILVFVAIIMAGAFLIAFVWAVKSGQYDDTYTPSVRILFDDPEIKESENSQKITKEKGNQEKQEAISV